jgi:putative transposase
VTEKYAFIRDEEGNYDVRKMCRWADVSRSGYLDWRDREPSRTARWRANLTEVVVHNFTDSERTYGYRRVHAEAARMGWPADPQTIRAIMTEQGLEAVCSRKRGPRTTIPAATGDTPDLLRRDFTSDTVGHKLVGDITYIPTWQGFAYLATVLDCATKKCVGYAIADHLRTDLIVDALAMAARNGIITVGTTIFHSDRGTQYLSAQFDEYTRRLGVRRSVGRTGICYDNSWAESFNATLKVERVHRTVYPTREHAYRDVTSWIELRYNQRRLHSGLGYRTPNEVESELMQAAAA